MQYKCYVCRKYKPATHAHFVKYGMLALRPLPCDITEIEAFWDYIPNEMRAESLEEGRQFFAHAEATLARQAETAPEPFISELQALIGAA